MSTLINTANPNAIRTVMVVDAQRGTACLQRFLNSELEDEVGKEAFAIINRGERAIFHRRYSRNLVAFDVELAAIKQNADLFKGVHSIER